MDASLGIPLLAFKSFSTKEAFPSRLWHASKYVSALNFFNHSNFYECPSYFAWQRAFHMFSFQILCERLAPGWLLILLCKNQRLTSVLQLIGGEKIALCDQSQQRLRRRVLRSLIWSENENVWVARLVSEENIAQVKHMLGKFSIVISRRLEVNWCYPYVTSKWLVTQCASKKTN